MKFKAQPTGLIIFLSALLCSCQELKDNVAMNRELFLAKTECFDEIDAVEEARMGVSTQGPYNDSMYQILTIQVKLKNGVSYTEMPNARAALLCLQPLLNKYPKLTHIGLQYKDDRTEERAKLEAYDVLVSKLSLEQ